MERQTIICGDSHNLQKFTKSISALIYFDIDFISVGDFGLTEDEKYNDEILDILDCILGQKNCTLNIVRGNHDNTLYFYENYKNKFKNIFFCKDYEIKTINGKNFLLIGGAISIDREIRIQKNYPYFKDEKFIYKKMVYENIDIVITHTCPNFVLDNKTEFANILGVKGEIYEESCLIENVYYDLIDGNTTPKFWFYGHFHRDRQKEINNTNFICVGEDKFLYLNNLK